MAYENGYYPEAGVTVIQGEAVRKITNEVDAVAKDITLHCHFGHAASIPSGCGAGVPFSKRKPPK